MLYNINSDLDDCLNDNVDDNIKDNYSNNKHFDFLQNLLTNMYFGSLGTNLNIYKYIMVFIVLKIPVINQKLSSFTHRYKIYGSLGGTGHAVSQSKNDN